MLNRQEDWQKAFGRPTAAFDARVRQTLNHLEEEKPMKRIALRAVILAAALLLILTGVVYAAVSGWKIGDYFNHRYGDTANVPKDFSSGFDYDYTQELDGLTFHIRDAYVDGDILNAIVEIGRSDGQPSLILTGDCMEDDPIGSLYIDSDSDDPASLILIKDYAREKGLPLYRAASDFAQQGTPDGGGDYWMEGDRLLACFVTQSGVQVENGQAAFEWKVSVRAEDGTLHQASMTVTLPVEEQKTWEVPVAWRVDGLPVILDTMTLREGRMGLYVDFTWHIDEKLGDEETVRRLQQGDINLWFRLIDPASGETLPGGATIGGEVNSKDDVHFIQTGDSVSAELRTDTLTIQAYDAWEKTRYGMTTVKIK